MGRRREVPKEQLNVRLPPDLLDRVREKLRDPVRNKTKHGSVTEVITALLYDWVHDDGKNTIDLL